MAALNQDEFVGEHDAEIRRMAAFAVMTVDWSSQRKSYLDNFINYVLSVIPVGSTTAFPRDAVRPSIIDRFNLRLPANIVQQLIRRCIRLGYLEAVGEAAITMTEKGEREVAPIPYTLKKLAQEQIVVSARFAQWASKELQVNMDSTRATSILLNYVETYYCALMSISDGDGSVVGLPAIEPSPEQKIAAAFVVAIRDSDEDLFDSIANMARGSMMVNALYAPSLVDTTRGFRHTTIYLDTKIVLRALGYEGEPAEQASVELIDILKRQGARVAIFDFTLKEIRSVLDAVAQKARTGRIWNARPGTVESYFYRENASNALIEQHSVRIETRVLDMGLYVDSSPSYENHRFVIDETEVEQALLEGNPNYRAAGLKHDVELIASMVRARSGRSRDSLEESRATFITLNSLVVNTARVAQRQYKEPWPLVMFEADVAALTWIKEPLAAPNLPRNQLLATSLGLTNPGQHDWGLYIGEIGRLLESGEITDNDLILLRQKYEMDKLAFVGNLAPVNDGTRRQEIRVSIEEARSAVAEQLTAPIQAEKDKAERESDRLLVELLRPVWAQARRIRIAVHGALIAICSAAILVTFIPEAQAWLSALPLGAVIVAAIRLIAVAAAVIGGLWGPTAKLGEYARVHYILRRLRALDVEPDRAAEVGYLTQRVKRAGSGSLSSVHQVTAR